MILCIGQVLSAEELEQLRSGLAQAPFVDGRATAGHHARLVKENRQADSRDPDVQALQRLVGQALRRNELFMRATRPKAWRPILFNLYESAMSYGAHVDNPIMGDGTTGRLRTDVSLTLFLSDPDDYDGGELIVEHTGGEVRFKLPGGAMVIYPGSTLHRVEPVSRGVRLAAVTWVQSLVRDPARRELLFDLDTAQRSLFQQHGKTREVDLIAKSSANLLRLWAEL